MKGHAHWLSVWRLFLGFSESIGRTVPELKRNILERERERERERELRNDLLYYSDFLISGVLAIALYTADLVHLLPGYPRNAPDSLLVAFYVQQPLGQFIGNVSVLPGVTLHDIVLNNTAQLEPAVGGKILRVEILFKPTTSPTEKPVEEESSFGRWKRIAIGVSCGAFLIILVIVISFLW